jgi:transposase
MLPYTNWELRKGTTVIAEIVDCNVDMPWYVGKYRPTSAFSEYEELFSEQVEIVDSDMASENWERVEEILRKLNSELSLVSMVPSLVASRFMVNVRGQTAWVRADFDDRRG